MHERIEKTSFFQHRFFIDFSSILASIWEGLGEVWGPKMGKLGVKKATQDRIAILEGFGRGLGRIWGGFWEGFGRFLGGSGSLLGALGASQGCFLAVLAHFWAVWVFFPCFWLIFGYFCCFWLPWAVVGCFC